MFQERQIFDLKMNKTTDKFKAKIKNEFDSNESRKFKGLEKILLENKHCAIGGSFEFKRCDTSILGKVDIPINALQFNEPEILHSIKKLYMKGNQANNLCVMVFRPFVVNNLLEELFINIFQTNGFIIFREANGEDVDGRLHFEATFFHSAAASVSTSFFLID